MPAHPIHLLQMKRMAIILALAASTILCRGQEGKLMVGADLIKPFRKSANIYMEYSFTSHWSVTGEINIYCINRTGEMSDMEKTHTDDLGKVIFKIPDSCTMETVSVRLWPEESFTGLSLGLGVRHQWNQGMDVIMGAGYTFRIWRRLMAEVRYSVGMREIIESDKTTFDRIGLKICYLF